MTRFLRYVLYSSPLLLGVYLYSYTLGMVFYSDDPINFITVESGGLDAYWGANDTTSSYRPMWLMALRGILFLFGYDPVPFYAMNIFAFGMVAVLTGQVLRRLAGQHSLGAIIAGLFVAGFPFSYQAVAWISSGSHIFLGFGILLGFWFGVSYLTVKKSFYLLACWLSVGFGVFSHENSVVYAPLGLLLVVMLWQSRRYSRRQLVNFAAPFVILPILFGVLWLVVPRPGNDGSRAGTDVVQGFAYMLQGLSYPLNASWDEFMAADGVGVVYILTGLVILLAGILLWGKSKQLWALAGFGLAWYGVNIIPATVILNTETYVFGSPRLMFLASIGGGLFWGALAFTRWGRVAVSGFLLLGLLWSLPFLAARQADYERLHGYAHNLFTLLDEAPIDDDETLYLVNAPSILYAEDTRFLLGREETALVEVGLSYNQTYDLNRGWAGYTVFDDFPVYLPILRDIGVPYQLYGQEISPERLPTITTPPNHIIMTRFNTDGFEPIYLGDGQPPESATPLYVFPDANIQILSASAQFIDGQVVIESTWLGGQPVAAKLFLHVLCDGVLIAQYDGYLRGNLLPFTQLSNGQVMHDRYPLNVDAPTECLSVRLGLYDEVSGVRFAIQDTASGDFLPDNSLMVPLAFD